MWRWLMLGLVACNQVYGLDETAERPAAQPSLPDQDEDGIADADDNCRLVKNATQSNADADGFGDACDLCVDRATANNHDEDGDQRGDECDLCPTEPNFQLDTDMDGVGDDCDNDFARQNRLVLFEPFVTIGTRWREVTTSWFSTGDTAVPVANDTRLENLDVTIDGNRPLWLRMGLSSTAAWTGGDRFGLELVDANTGGVVAGCIVTCSAVGDCFLTRLPATPDLPPYAMPEPFETMEFNQTITVAACVMSDAVDSDALVALGPARLVLVGTPKVQIRYVAIWQ